MNTTRNTITAPAMTREEWERLPAEVKRFLPWERAQLPAVIVDPKPAKARGEGYKHFTEGKP
jgi:hypothetical protein